MSQCVTFPSISSARIGDFCCLLHSRKSKRLTHCYTAYADGSSRGGVSVSHRRQCHDLVCNAHATLVWDCLTDCFRNAVIIGPADTPFEDGTFRLVMHFEEQYPNKPPGVKFISQMFHPNVYGTGELCLDILQNRWSPTYDVAAILTSIQRFEPNPY